MPKRIKQKVVINGKEQWITAYSQAELLEKYRMLLESSQPRATSPLFIPYLKDFIASYKTNQASLTQRNREQLIKKHIEPRFCSTEIAEITTSGLQKWFDSMAEEYSHETLMKLKNIMSPALDAAVEDEYITRNPFKSVRLTIRGRETIQHKAIPREIIQAIREQIVTLPFMERRMCALLCYTGMRFEEVLGARWEDISTEAMTVSVKRAVVHPKRNQPEIKLPKTKTSIRTIPISKSFLSALGEPTQGFIVFSKKADEGQEPMSYTEAKRCFEHIRKAFDLKGYTAHDFRDTCATEWREKGISLDLIARFLGHSKTETTEQRYVHYDSLLTGVNGTLQNAL